MFTLASFLEKFKNIGLQEAEFKEFIMECVKTDFSSVVSAKDVRVQSGILYIKANPGLKSEIFMRKTQFLGKINAHYPKKTIVDVR